MNKYHGYNRPTTADSDSGSDPVPHPHVFLVSVSLALQQRSLYRSRDVRRDPCGLQWCAECCPVVGEHAELCDFVNISTPVCKALNPAPCLVWPPLHQNAFGGPALPRPAGGAYSAPPDPSWIWGGRWRQGEDREGKGWGNGKGGRGKRQGKGRDEAGNGIGEKTWKGRGMTRLTIHQCWQVWLVGWPWRQSRGYQKSVMVWRICWKNRFCAWSETVKEWCRLRAATMKKIIYVGLLPWRYNDVVICWWWIKNW